jgi:SPP1 gp7 family putative phage head morphogenesis protein
MNFDLATLTRRTHNPRRSSIVLRDIVPPATLATDLYRAVYLPIVQAWERAAAGIVAEYERTLSITQNSDARILDNANSMPIADSPDDLQARLDAAQSEAERLFILLDAALRDWGVRVERWQREKWRGAVLSATGVDIATLIGPEDMRETVGTYLRWNSELVRDISAQARQRISNAVFSGLQNRTPVREVAKSIREATGMARARAQRVAADQLSKITSSLADERRREAGIDQWKWRHSGKLHARAEHLARNGKVYSEDDAPQDRPGQLPYCGCRAQAVLVLD